MIRSRRQVYYEIPEVAKILGWEYRKAWRWLKREKVLVWRAGRLVTTRERLVAAFPEVWQRLAAERTE